LRWLTHRRGNGSRDAGVAKLLRDAVEDHFLTRAHFQPVAAVGGLQEEDVVTGKSQDALDWGGNVLVKPVRKLDHDNGPVARRPHEATCDNATTFAPKFPEHHIHKN
jgi:hypothetical protein